MILPIDFKKKVKVHDLIAMEVYRIQEYSNNNTDEGVLRVMKRYRILRARIPLEEDEFVILDKNMYYGIGIHLFTLKKIPEESLKKIPDYKAWYKDGVNVWEVIPSVDSFDFFKNVVWKDVLDNFLFQGKSKDPRLVSICKSHWLPIYTGQNSNNHSLLFTNSSTGKSSFCEIFGKSPITDFSEAGLIGGVNKGKEQKGQLSGEGFIYLDEINVKNTEIVKLILNYLENGVAIRAIIPPVEVHGTKCVVLTGNPIVSSDPNLLIFCFKVIIESISGVESSFRIGKRFGLLAYGLDYKYLDSKGISINEDEDTDIIRDVVNSVMIIKKQDYIKAYSFFRSNFDYERYDYYKEECLKIAKIVPDPVISNFIKGFGSNITRVATSAFKSFMLDNLDSFVLKKSKDFFKLLKNGVYDYMDDLIKINLESISKLNAPIKNYNFDDFRELWIESSELKQFKEKQLASFFGKSERTIVRWLSLVEEEVSSFSTVRGHAKNSIEYEVKDEQKRFKNGK